jgi:hypothetical protein
MMVEGSNRRIHTVDRHAGLARVRAQPRCTHARVASAPVGFALSSVRSLLLTCCALPQAVAGLAPDGRVLVTRARGEAAQYIRHATHAVLQTRACHNNQGFRTR